MFCVLWSALIGISIGLGFVSGGSISVTTSSLPSGTGYIAAAAAKSGDGTKTYLAGGYSITSCGVLSLNSLAWTIQPATPGTFVTLLSGGRFEMGAAAANAGTAVLFAGGVNASYAVVDSIDHVDGAVTTRDAHRLSVPRAGMASANIGNLVVFAGGAQTVKVTCSGTTPTTTITYSNPTTAVDIYNTATNTWTTSSLQQHVYFPAAAVSGTRLYLAGGWITSTTPSTTLQTFDSVSKTWSIRLITVTGMQAALTLPSSGNIMLFTAGYIGMAPIIYRPTTNDFLYLPSSLPLCNRPLDGRTYGMYLGSGAVGFFCASAALSPSIQLMYSADSGDTWVTDSNLISSGQRPTIIEQQFISSTGTVYSFSYDPTTPPDSTTGQCCGASLLGPHPFIVLILLLIVIIWFF